MVAWLPSIAFDGGPPVQCTNSVSHGGSIIVLQYVPLHGNRCRVTRLESGIVVNEVPASTAPASSFWSSYVPIEALHPMSDVFTELQDKG